MKFIISEEQSNFLLHDLLDDMFEGYREVYATPEEKLIYVGDKLLMIKMPTKAILSKEILDEVQNVLFYDTMKDFKDSLREWVVNNFPVKSGYDTMYGITFKDFGEKIKIKKRKKNKVQEQDDPLVKLAKKRIDKHFLNNFKLIRSWDELPNVFKKIFNHNSGSDDLAIKRFEQYLNWGPFLVIRYDDKRYLINLGPNSAIAVDDSDHFLDPEKLERDLKLSYYGLTFEKIIKILKNREEQSKEISKLSESDIIRVVNKLIQ